MEGYPEPKILNRDYSVKPEDANPMEYMLRKLLFHQHSGLEKTCMLYGDDGELQCQSCDIDFLRDSGEDIESRLMWIGMQKLIQETK